ncbi:polyhydroxyalkanoate synthase [Plasticicumulans lactativorans]|uniref:Polyhydroxyalkanoate synthase n=1 Tax=Plasticicumulans lactativorans TaxID=1133106 RepID=A0A4R2L6G8_9GAMM|nr:class I poly(R)-hydroxyalkanoic acid synthase [Plasticicumulans lactativorans]TCO82089.1 polyhydroxyalkanoate synthase [Plasticicumulans lactativorans]
MAEAQAPEIKMPDPVEVSKAVTKIAEQSQRLVADFLQRQSAGGALALVENPSLGSAFLEMTRRLLANPGKLVEAQIDLWKVYVNLWTQGTSAVFFGQNANSAALSTRSDKRFKHDDWEQNALFDYIKQAYLLSAQWVQSTVAGIEGMDEKTKKKIEFYTRQFVDALSPTNFPITNPEVLRATIETGGENLLKGLSNLLDDLERGKGSLNIRMTDLEAFQPGVNIAATPGKVVFQNELMQLLQYAPSTETVFQKPLLIVPPWINKFYILDLREKNSFIKWWVDQGFTVFVISWVNPDVTLAEKNFENYLTEGTLAALDAIAKATGEQEVNAVGYCLGGTLLASTVGYLAARKDTRIASATYFTTMLDFDQPGELEVFIDEEQISMLEKRMERQGFLDGSEMAGTFSMLRANDLIWSFFINNYLLGKDPFPFDLLYWNSDSTRMPAKMHSFYLRNMYQKNLLREPGGITLADTPIDLRKAQTPAYFISAIEDHIAPWKSTYAGTRLFGGPVKFVLGGSGHIAGVINPPVGGKYCYWENAELPAGPDAWYAGARQSGGSWWPNWLEWVRAYAGEQVPARVVGAGELAPIEDAPGSYVKRKLIVA